MRYAIGYHRVWWELRRLGTDGRGDDRHTPGRERPCNQAPGVGDDAHLVRKAYEMRLEGRTYKEINRATRLFPFLQSYREMLKNPIYKGVLEWGGEMYEDYAPPIVDADLWQQVQVVSARMTRHPRRVSSSYLLSGLMKCRRCGSNMNGNTSVRKDKTHRYYRCSHDKTFDDTEPCSMRFIVAQDLEDKVMGRLAEFYLWRMNWLRFIQRCGSKLVRWWVSMPGSRSRHGRSRQRTGSALIGSSRRSRTRGIHLLCLKS